MNAHTPGPWRYTLSPADMNATVYGPHRDHVCEVWSGRHPNMGTLAANAALITAAPAMYQALELIAAECERLGLDEVGDIRPARIAREALNKAKGQP